MATTTTTTAAVSGGVTYYSKPNNNNITNNNPLILNKVTLRYQDGGKFRDDPSYDDTDDEIYYQNQINDDNISINEPFYFDESHHKSNKSKKGDSNRNKDNNLSIQKSLNRLSLLKFRENNGNNNDSSSRNVDSSRKKNHNKVNAIVSEIVPLITNRDNNEITSSIYNEYFDQASTYVPSVKSQATTLPKMTRTGSVYQARNSSKSNVPSATPVIAQSLPRPYSNDVKNKSKVFNLVFGINNKFVQKYLPRDKQVTRHSLYLNEKLPGHIALYKLMKDSEKLNINPSNSTELDRIRKEILSRHGLNQIATSTNDTNNSVDNVANNNRIQLEQVTTPRVESINPINFSFNRLTLQRTNTFHEISPRRANNSSNMSFNRSQSPSLSIGTQALKNPDSVAVYLSHLKQDK